MTLDPSQRPPGDRAERLALALAFYSDFANPQPITHGPPAIWRGGCTKCGRYSCEISSTDDAVLMQCMHCGHEPNWRKLEHVAFIPRFEPDPRQLRINQHRDRLLRPCWLYPQHGRGYDVLDDATKAVWNSTRDQTPVDPKVWTEQLANAAKVGLITTDEALDAAARYDRMTDDAGS